MRMFEGRDLESRRTEYLGDVRRAAPLVPERDRQILDWRLNDVAWPEIARRLSADNVDTLRKQHQRTVARVAKDFADR